MHKDMVKYLENPKANKIAFIKMLREVSGLDLRTVKPWADRLWAADIDEIQEAMYRLKDTHSLAEARVNLVAVLDEFCLCDWFTRERFLTLQANQEYVVGLKEQALLTVKIVSFRDYYKTLAHVY